MVGEERENHRTPLDWFLINLAESREAYDADHRHGCQLALIAVMVLLSRLNPRDELGQVQPFRALMMALHDLDRGIISPLVARKKIAGKRPTPSPEMHVKTMALSAINGLLQFDDPDEGQSMDERLQHAARRVAAVLNAHEFPIGGQIGTPDWQVLLHLRENMAKGRYDQNMQALAEEFWPAFGEIRGMSNQLAKDLICAAVGGVLAQRDWPLKKR